MSAAAKAVFLSYASQDADAARKICDALRAAGVEVWFDQSELRGGDAWDAKIRKQIKECALFVPIISANTQARPEGYFRLEWRLADQRSHLMSRDHPFIVPVVIDETRDVGARVPDSFLDVQWTRLPAGETPPAFGGRVSELLKRDAEVKVAPLPSSAAGRAPGTGASRPSRWKLALIPACLLLAAGGIALQRWNAGPPGATSTSPAPVSEARKLAQQARALIDDDLLAIRENYRLAEELCRKAVGLDVGDAEAWATWARVSAGMMERNYDASAGRLAAMRSQAERAIRLAPDSIESGLAIAALAMVSGNNEEAETALRDLLAKAPRDSRVALQLGKALAKNGKPAEATELRLNHPAFGGRDPRPLVDEARSMMSRATLTAKEKVYQAALVVVDRAQALAPSLAGYELKLVLVVQLRLGTLDEGKALVETIPGRIQQEDAIAAYVARLWLWRRDGDRALAALRRAPSDFLEEGQGFGFTPKGNLTGWAHDIAGRPAAAKAEWTQALAVVEKRVAAEPERAAFLRWKAQLLALIGRREEADAAWQLHVEMLGRSRPAPRVEAEFLLATGRKEEAITRLQGTVMSSGPHFLAFGLRDNPWFAAIRDDPRVQALIAEGQAMVDAARPGSAAARGNGGTGATSSPDPKSVVVLPFANLSGDPAQEYFSDGVTEEILNALGRERDLRVVPRTSAFAFKHKNLSSPEIARALNVAQVVDGSVRRAGNVVRINSTLTRAEDGFAQPLQQFEREMKDATDIFALQEDVARAVVEKLTRRATTAAPLAVPTKNAEAYEAFLRGRDLMNQTSPSWPKAVEAFRRAVDLDPQFAAAWAKLGHVSAALYAYGFDGRGLAESERAVREALRLRPDLREVHLAQAFLLRATSAPHPAIERELALAMKDRADDPEVLQIRGEMLLARGDDEEGIRILQRGAILDAQNGALLNMLGNALAATGRYDEAETVYRRAFDVLGSSVPWTNRARVYFHGRGDTALAARTLDEAPDEIRTERYWTGRALLLYMIGDQSRALAAAVHMQPRSGFFRIRQFFTAKMREASGDAAGARRDFLEALPLAEQQRDEFPALPTPHAILALVYAGLERKTEALEVARKAVALGQPAVGPNSVSERNHAGRSGVGALSLVDLELSSDAALAQVHARFGQVDEALAIVATNVAAGHWRRNNLLRNPDWAILRKDPRFRSIAEKAPL